ncbi:MAG: HAD family hydrolase [Spirochaetota bacterium]
MEERSQQELPGSIAAILFDKDGTLFDFRRTWLPFLFDSAKAVAEGDEALADELIRAGGYDPDTGRFAANGPIAAGNAGDLAEAWLGVITARGAEEARQSGKPTKDALVAELNRRSRDVGPDSGAPVTDLPALFSRLRRADITLGLATSDTTEAAREALERHRVIDFFSYVAGYDAPAGKKPAGEVATAFYEPLGLPPSRVMVVGDTLHDMTMAGSCGCLAVAVLSGAAEREDLAPYADIVLESIAELPALLGV